ncbi:MAG TPA: hypothetical protein VLM75_15590 [Spirochaetota bacterium]|nr:hypothetical protein [Spirochaetota bacterium]
MRTAGAALFGIVLIFFCIIPGCRPAGVKYRMDAPAGFAVYTKDADSYRAISADGVRVRARRVENNPPGDAAMWGQAVEAHLKNRGYHRIAFQQVTARNGWAGSFTEYAYWYNAEEYRYAVTIFVTSEHIYLLEAGGTTERYARKREGIIKSLGQFSVE